MRAEAFLRLLRADKVEAGATYALDGTLTLGEQDSDRVWSLGGAVLRFSAGVTVGIRILSPRVTLSDVTVSMAGGVGISAETCSVCLASLTVCGARVGIRLGGHDLTVTDCRVHTCDEGITGEFVGAEVSAAMGEGYDLLLSRNTFSECNTDIRLTNATNAILIRNHTDTVTLTECLNLYVIGNTVDGALTFRNDRYVIADENCCTVLAAENCTEVNGADLTDLTVRTRVGVNEALLPHINRELFVGMTRKTAVQCARGFLPIGQYLREEVRDGEVILPPGAYVGEPLCFAGLDGLRVYAYGALLEMTAPNRTAVTVENCRDLRLYGLFIGHDVYPHTQGTVTSVEGETVAFRADPGYRENFADGRFYGGGAPGFFFREGRFYPECDFVYKGKSYDPTARCNLLTAPTKPLAVGDRVAFRTGFGEGALLIKECDGLLFEDVTVFSCSGFAESDKNCLRAPTLHRYAVTAGPAPVLAEDGDYADFKPLLWRDGYGRLRSAEPLNTSCDATHCTNARRGIRIVSSLFERMNDDAGNINAFYGLARSFDPETHTLRFGRSDSRGYRFLPAPIKSGDRILVYTFGGKLLCDAIAETDAAEVEGDDQTVVLDRTLTLPEDEQVAVQNASASGGGFLIDNVLVRDAGCNGFRIKAVGGEVRNSSFVGVSKGAMDLVPEFQLWPECGYAQDVRILQNRFERLGKTATLSEASEDCAWCAAINVRYSLWDKGANATTNVDYCLHRNIEIADNDFVESYPRYEIAISAASSVQIHGNRFGTPLGVNPRNRTLLLFGGNGIQLWDNRYPTELAERVEYRFGKETVVCDNEDGTL